MQPLSAEPLCYRQKSTYVACFIDKENLSGFTSMSSHGQGQSALVPEEKRLKTTSLTSSKVILVPGC